MCIFFLYILQAQLKREIVLSIRSPITPSNRVFEQSTEKPNFSLLTYQSYYFFFFFFVLLLLGISQNEALCSFGAFIVVACVRFFFVVLFFRFGLFCVLCDFFSLGFDNQAECQCLHPRGVCTINFTFLFLS